MINEHVSDEEREATRRESAGCRGERAHMRCLLDELVGDRGDQHTRPEGHDQANDLAGPVGEDADEGADDEGAATDQSPQRCFPHAR
jgi:hypothetical protein